MIISDVEILSLNVESDIQKMIDEHQEKIVARALDLNAAQQSAEVEASIIALNREKVKLGEEYAQFKVEQEAATRQKAFELDVARTKAQDEEVKRQQEIAAEIQGLKDALFMAEQERQKIKYEAELAHKKALADIEAEREAKAAESMKVVLSALGPELAAALNNSNNRETIKAIANAISPYALANGDNVADAVNTMLRGTTLEEIVTPLIKNKN